MGPHLLRSARTAQGAQEGNQTRCREHVRLHRARHRSLRRVAHSAEQLEGAGETVARVHYSCHRHRGRDVPAIHSAASTDERVQVNLQHDYVDYYVLFSNYVLCTLYFIQLYSCSTLYYYLSTIMFF